ncbi:inner membrane protein YihY [Liquorilactobacillus sucicola DSM 21376 = JCM 15457]|uniref:Ribonuclease BN n=2 Tax=Liquorilactobacillus sucicola TaxID=519050 RepID=A0A023D0E3_9LACO|nr:ribonuclease BN [Liquorilactobacillus sucicola DSM 21376 = JCM 15457]GAJ27291.1 inner membrane protein YihY [Liquorilactobacillus sucicola DSM 21376 = JCM 15457]
MLGVEMIKGGKSSIGEIIKIIKSMFQRATDIDISNTSIVIAYYSLLAFFPSIILVGNVLPLLNIKAGTVLSYLETAVPATIYETLHPIVISFLNRGSGGLISISALVALWAASKGINALKLAMNNAYDVEDSQGAITARLISFFLTIVFAILLISIIILFSFGQMVLSYITPILNLPVEFVGIFGRLKWPLTFFGLFIILSLMYYFLPNANLHLLLVFPGALLATVGWIILAQGFSIYVHYFARSVLSYGTIGTFIVLLFWLNYSGWVIMLGASLNATLEYRQHNIIKPKEGKLRKYLRNNYDK